ncbi:hypothetical protein DS909_15065 [Phaeobacter gallaeciensis]|uniref:Uncharacterized protein n=1 Tax=Phaeobacter gallaeciensis TaxID=60890 RepID=A0A366WYH6_9RHOB|nr:hypothetical protein DS909_15065 [Phaeobacter gallaeciensis]
MAKFVSFQRYGILLSQLFDHKGYFTWCVLISKKTWVIVRPILFQISGFLLPILLAVALLSGIIGLLSKLPKL